MTRCCIAIVALLLSASGASAGASGPAGPPDEIIPVFPPYPYRAGHYPTVDAYWDLPPYAALPPSYYRWRYFLTAQERNRYRYVPHIFRGYGDGDGYAK